MGADEYGATLLAGDAAGIDPTQIPRGTLIGRYVIIDVLGRGGMGVVYAAFDPELDRKIALKLLRRQSDEDGRQRTRREAQALARLKHPNVLTVYDVGDHRDGVFIAMELVDGGTLRAWQDKRDWRAIVGAYIAAGRGLAAAHARELVHRDFKPDNALVDRDGRILVTDFGLVRIAGREDLYSPIEPLENTALTVTGAVMGTLGYMPPEQAAGDEVDARGDQFAWCVSLWEALYDVRPFGGGPYEAYMKALAGPMPSVPEKSKVPKEIGRALLRGLAQNPSDRWPSMEPLLAAVAPRRSRRVWIVGAVLALAAVGGAAFALENRSTTVEQASCIAAPKRLTGVWDDQRRAQLAMLFATVQRPDVAAMLKLATDDLDAYAADWTRQWTAACASPDRKTDPLLYQQRLNCLDRSLIELQGVSQSMLEVEPGTFSTVATGTLFWWSPALEGCELRELVRAMPPAPRDEVRDEVAKLVVEIHRARATARSVYTLKQGSIDEAVRRLDRATTRLDELGDSEAAYAAFVRAYYLQPAFGNPQRAFDDAASRAIALGRKYREDHALVLVLSIQIKSLIGQDKLDAAIALQHEMELVAERGGQPPALRPLSEIAAAKYDWNEVLRLASMEPAFTPWQHWPLVEVPTQTVALAMLGRFDDALATARNEVARIETLWPRESIASLEAHRILAEWMLRTSRPPNEVLSVLEPAIAAAEQIGAAVATSLTSLRMFSIAASIRAGKLEGLDGMATKAAGSEAWRNVVGWAAQLGLSDVVGVARLHLSKSRLDEDVDVAAFGSLGELDRAAMIVRARTPFDPKHPDPAWLYVAVADAKKASSSPFEIWARTNDPGAALAIAYYRQDWRSVVEIAARSPNLAETMIEVDVYQAVALIELGDARHALPLLERFVLRCIQDNLDGVLAEGMFPLARALWDTGGDRERARRLATLALSRVPPGARAEVVPQIQAWLAAHP